MGHLKGAVQDYEAASKVGRSLAKEGEPLLGKAAAPQWLSYYQRELALYNFAHLDRRMSDYCMDCDMRPVMKGDSLPPTPPLAPLHTISTMTHTGTPPPPYRIQIAIISLLSCCPEEVRHEVDWTACLPDTCTTWY